jgi:hypothetical protein
MGGAFLVKTPKKQTDIPSINVVDTTAFTITFTLTNNDEKTAEVFWFVDNDLGSVNLQSNQTSSNITATVTEEDTLYVLTTNAKALNKTSSENVTITAQTPSSFTPLQATGGAITNIGDFRYHAFTTTGTSTFSVTNTGTTGLIDYLIIAGGGGGGGFGGGGGAGGVVFGEAKSATVNNFSIVVGGGGSGVTNAQQINGGNGGNSSAFGFTANGGGGGGTRQSNNTGRTGNAGGSGGGGSHANSAPRGLGGSANQPAYSGHLTYGNNGAQGKLFFPAPEPSHKGGGGGGAGGPGIAPSDTSGTFTPRPNGGPGIGFSTYFPNWGTNSSNTTTGTRGYFAGGGGGMSFLSASGAEGLGGVGGGGNGGNEGTPNIEGAPGQANTGGGGGSSRWNGSSARGGDGGNGIVIIRYRINP